MVANRGALGVLQARPAMRALDGPDLGQSVRDRGSGLLLPRRTRAGPKRSRGRPLPAVQQASGSSPLAFKGGHRANASRIARSRLPVSSAARGASPPGPAVRPVGRVHEPVRRRGASPSGALLSEKQALGATGGHSPSNLVKRPLGHPAPLVEPAHANASRVAGGR